MTASPRYRSMAFGITAAVALLLMIAPWATGPAANIDATWVSKFAGLMLLLGPVTGIAGFAERGAFWTVLCGLTAAIAPFAVGFAGDPWLLWPNLAGGIVAALLAVPMLGRTYKTPVRAAV
ncbi:MAG: SPW repeat protein [Alphaproteobacteria bacterium]|nr:SPW repeat protein [Alphaproteobacteria bacterium]